MYQTDSLHKRHAGVGESAEPASLQEQLYYNNYISWGGIRCIRKCLCAAMLRYAPSISLRLARVGRLAGTDPDSVLVSA
jgi:hypothetical protein